MKYHFAVRYNVVFYLQFLGTWYELERSFYLPEIASGCTSMTFKDAKDALGYDGNTIEIRVKSLNQW